MTSLSTAATLPGSARPQRRSHQLVLDMLRLQKSRRALSLLGDDALRDIGLTREQAHKEARRPFWDLADLC